MFHPGDPWMIHNFIKFLLNPNNSHMLHVWYIYLHLVIYGYMMGLYIDIINIPGWWLSHPSEKTWARQLGWWNSQYMETYKMFQTTNDCYTIAKKSLTKTSLRSQLWKNWEGVTPCDLWERLDHVGSPWYSGMKNGPSSPGGHKHLRMKKQWSSPMITVRWKDS